MSRVLNLGCGNKLIKEFEDRAVVNHDRIKHRPEVDVIWDLDVTPWPWADNTFDQVYACAVLEHLRISLLDSINECHRILRAGGLLQMKLPYWKHEMAYNDPTHFWKCGLGVLDVFDPTTRRGMQYNFYTWRKWKILGVPRLNKEQTSIIAAMEAIK